MALIISVSGLRGIVGSELNPEVAVRYCGSFAALAPPGPILVSYDGRVSGPMLLEAVVSALVASGRQVINAGLAATPTVGVLVREHGAAGAVQISASHNPPAYNGMKLFGPDGRVLSAGSGQAIKEHFQSQAIPWCGVEQFFETETLKRNYDKHLDAVLRTVPAKEIQKCRFRVLLDSNRAAGCSLGIALLEALDCQITFVGGEPDGRFNHPPEPISENLQEVARAVRQHGCQIGFCQDPDADRLALIDAEGRYIGEEYTVALCVKRVLMQQQGPVVINCATSSMTEHICKSAGAQLYRSAVGEANVADEMVKRKAVYGGEGNGGPIDPRVGYVRDSFVGMAQILDLMRVTGKSLSELAGELPPLQIVKQKVDLTSEQLAKRLDLLVAAFPDAQGARPDGLRLDWPDGRWLIVRGSNTEPIVRLIAEGRSVTEANELCSRAANVLQGRGAG
jgi:phosphomannomutase